MWSEADKLRLATKTAALVNVTRRWLYARRLEPARQEAATAKRKAALFRPGKLTGYVARFGCKGRGADGILTTIRPGAFRRALERGDDIQAIIHHDPRWFLASTRDGTLRLREDSLGLFAEIDLPLTLTGQWIAALVMGRRVLGMSFAYEGATQHYDADGVRVITDVGRLIEVGPGGPGRRAGFRQTSVTWQPDYGGFRR